MLFNSYEFLIFFPVVWAAYWLLPRRRNVQNALLLLASYIFYAWWDVRFVTLIAGMTLFGWTCALAIERLQTEKKAARAVCTLGVAGNLAVLGAFKYYDFFAESLNTALSAVRLGLCLPLWRIVLPVGISFYTFQLVAYLVDVYKKRTPPCRDLLAFSTFVSFFPQLVAGPIERASDLLPQIRRPDYALMADGARLMLWGFAKKMLLADRCAPLVAAIYSNPQSDGTDLWAGTILFALQIYGDFSGYSDIAVGAGKLFGIRLSRNFNLPYFSTSVNEFWRRWHITLMSFLRDYVYIPLGGSRKGIWRTLRNTFIVFTVSGLWHGANWTFVAWGVYFALWSGVGVVVKRLRKGEYAKEHNSSLRNTLKNIGQMTLTFLIVCVGWVFFRSESIATAFTRLGEMFSNLQLHSPYGGTRAWIAPLLIIGAEWITRNQEHPLCFPATPLLRRRAVRWAVYYALIFAILCWGGSQTAFIYFQF